MFVVVRFGLWIYSGFWIDYWFFCNDIEFFVDLMMYVNNSEWDFFFVIFKKNIWIYFCCDDLYFDIMYVFYIWWKIFYYIFNIIVFCVMLLVLILLMFWLFLIFGEKIILGLFVFLVFFMFMLLIVEEVLVILEFVFLIGKLCSLLFWWVELMRLFEFV